MSISYWLMKTEPDTFSISDLYYSPNQTIHWDGVRNYQARNMMRDQMQCGDLVFLYHSNCAIPGIVGIAEIVREAYPDFTCFDPHSPYFDPKSTPEKPRWFMVDIKFKNQFPQIISLNELRTYTELSGMPLLRKGNRLSILPVSVTEWEFIIACA
ncbi:MAG: hypothetical protein LEGION0398_MBIBDBAK_00382 [Legionellaceae bacterium]